MPRAPFTASAASWLLCTGALLACVLAGAEELDASGEDSGPACSGSPPPTAGEVAVAGGSRSLLQRNRSQAVEAALIAHSGNAYSGGEDDGHWNLPHLGSLSIYAVALLVTGWYAKLAVLNGLYAFRYGSADDKEPKGRLVAWDVMRFLLELMVIATHCSQYLFQTSEVWTTVIRMPAFVFIAGVFGSSVAYRSVTSMLCYCLGTAAMATVVDTIVQRILSRQVGVPLLLSFEWSLNLFWFLPGLFVWRMTITPLFHYAKVANVPRVIPLVVVQAVSYLLLHTSLNTHWLSRMTLYQAPSFAVGLLLSPSDWSEALAKPGIVIVAAGTLVSWYLLLVLYPEPRAWNSVACLARCRDDHVPNVAVDAHLGLESFAMDTAMVLLRTVLSLSFCTLVQACVVVLEPRARRLVSCMSGWGSRTLYAYVLHNLLLKAAGHKALSQIGPRLLAASGLPRLLLVYLFALQFNVVLSSRGTETIFRWMMLPLWLRDLAERVAGAGQTALLRYGSAQASPAAEPAGANPVAAPAG
mmetsp:Transcript_35601/g.80482  ORF Transcript_35601/g.80482 Transcript_35601/m.80482 type:complete len:526 (-) Transcript_35601:105-1682(-)